MDPKKEPLFFIAKIDGDDKSHKSIGTLSLL